MGQTTRERILEAARELWREQGSGMSMRKVAGRVGVSATAIYRHFEDKEALLEAVCAQGFERLAGFLMRGLTGPSPEARLERAALGFGAFAVEHPADYRLMFMTDGGERLGAARREAFGPALHFLGDRVAECQRSGVVVAGEPGVLAQTVWAHHHGLIALWLGGSVVLEAPEEAWRAHHEVLMGGLGVR